MRLATLKKPQLVVRLYLASSGSSGSGQRWMQNAEGIQVQVSVFYHVYFFSENEKRKASRVTCARYRACSSFDGYMHSSGVITIIRLYFFFIIIYFVPGTQQQQDHHNNRIIEYQIIESDFVPHIQQYRYIPARHFVFLREFSANGDACCCTRVHASYHTNEQQQQNIWSRLYIWSVHK